jgi:hypothetical protein
MRFKSKFFIVFPRKLVDEISWPDTWGSHCVANLPTMLSEVLGIKFICGEIKLIWNEDHRWRIKEDNKVSHHELDDYLKADCNSLHFASEKGMKRAAKELTDRGGKGYICVDNYRDVIIQQAFYRRNGSFNTSNL